jgi:hypothetical protein
MASPFNLTAQINLRGPTNLKPIVSQIRKQLGSVNTDISLNIDNKALKSIDTATNRLAAMNKVLVSVRSNATSLNQTLRDMSSSLGSVQTSSNAAAGGVRKTSQNIEKVAKDIKVARTEMEEFGKQSALAIRRFAAFSVVTTGIFALTNAVTGAFKEFINFDKELVRLQQVTGRGATGVKILQDEITNLAISLGVSSTALLEVTSTLAQAGLSVEETRIALKALAKTELAPSFESLTKTTEGAIAAIRQFGLEAGELEAALGSINAVAAAFAVESGDIIAAIQRTGGVFASASKGVSEGTDALNEFIAIFTSVRQTTRESAETIATGLRTIFTRIQRSSTIQQLKQFGVELQDLEGKFVGPFEAIRRLSDALNQLDPRDIRFSTIVEELGGFRQIGKVIPLIQQFAVAQQALGVAQRGQSSLTDAQIKAQQSLANQIAKVREQFLGLIREVGQSTVFQGFFKIVVGLTSGLLSLASAFKPILPILAVFGAIKGVSAIGQFATGFFGGLKKGGGAGGAGQNIGESLSGAKEKQRAEVTAKAADAIRLNTDALKTLTSAVQSLDSTMRSRGSSTLRGGGKVLGFNKGGIVPGSGKGDKVPAMLEPGEVVINNQAAQKYGRGNLAKMNKLAKGGKAKVFVDYAEPGFINTDYLDQGLADIVNKGKSQFLPPGKKGIDETKSSIQNFRLYRSVKGSLLEQTLRRSKPRGTKESAGGTFDYSNWPGNVPAFDNTKLIGLPTDARLSKNRATPELFQPKIQKYLDRATGGEKNRKNFGAVVFEEGEDTSFDVPLSLGGIVQKFMAGSVGGVNVPSGKGRGKTGARGARSKFKELTQEEIYKLSTEDLIRYAKDQAYDIFSTAGAGMVIGNEFVEVPQERIVPELESELTTYLGKKGFWREKISPFASEQKIKASVHRKMDARTLRKMVATAGGVDSSSLENVPMDVLLKYAEQAPRAPKEVLEATIARYQKDSGTKGGFLKRFEQSAKSGEFISGKPLLDEIPDIPERLIAFRKSLEKELSETQDEKLRKSVLDKIVKASNAIQEAKDYQKDILPTVTGRASHFAWAMRQAIPESKNFANGGLVQKFMAGSVGGVETPVGKISQQILDRIQKVGGSGYITANVSYDEIQKAVAKARAVMPKVGTAKQLLTLPSLKSLDNGSLLEKIIEPLLKQAEEKKEAEKAQQAGQKQLNEQAATGKGLKFGLASLYGPNGELGYSNITSAKELLGKDGSTKYLTQLVRKSLPTRYADAVSKIQQDIAGLPARGAEQFQYTDIFGAIGPLAFDFDETLVKDADIPGKKNEDYSDLKKVRDSLQNSKLTLLGKELAKRLIDYPELMDKIRVLTARPQSNAPLLASKLSSLGLPIPESKITGVSGGLNKVDNLAELETLVDDNLENIGAVTGAGKLGYLYREPQNISAANQSSNRAIAAMEGYGLEEIVKQLGIGISSDDANPLRPIDYPSGLGYAANTWGIDPKMPTDTKRTNDSSAVSRLWAEAQKYIVQNFAFGGKADGPGFEEIKQQIIDKYPEIQFRISKRKRAFGYNLMGALKSKGGLSGDSGLNFQQPGNLKQLQAYSDKLAAKLMNPEQLAAGGLLAEPVQSTSSQTQKNFGKVALRTGNRIQATYIKEGEAAAARSGQVIADSIGGGLYAVQSSSATKGYGPKLYDIVMEAATAAGGMLTSDRRTVSDAAKSVWAYYFNNRSDVKKTPLNPENWVSNSRLLDEKLYGPPDTWPSATDPAWILQSGYSKSPSDINNPNLVQKLAGGGSSGTVPAMVSNGEAFVPPKVAKKIGYAKLDKMNQADRNGMKGFAGGGISVFNGPGSGTSDSIGPIGLPTGSYVIREKATKALGLNKGGSVGVRKFFKGGQNKKDAKRAQGEILQDVEQAGAVLAQIMAQLPDQIREVLLKKFKGLKDLEPGESLMGGTPAFTENTRGQAASSESAAAIGLKITGKKGGATTETVAHETGHLADFELGGGKAASEIEGTFQFELVAKIRKQMEEAFIAAGESSNRINDYLLRGKELFAEFFAKASPEVRAIITSTTDAKTGMAELAKTLGETGYTYAGLEASDIDTSASTPKPQPPLPIIPPSGLPPAPPSGPSFVFPPSPPDPPNDKQKKPKPQQEGRLSKEERKKRKEAYTAKSREGGLTREEARAVGVVREDFGGSSTIDPVSSKVLKYREESAQKQEKAALDELKAATEAQDAAKKQLEEAKKRKQNLGKSSTQTERQTAKDAVKAAETQLGETQSRKSQATNKVAEARQKAVDVEEAKKAATVSTNTPDANKEKAKSDLQKTADQEVADAMEQVRKNVTQKYQDILQTEVDNIRAFYATRIAAAGKNSKEEANLIQQQRSAIADTKASIEAAQTGEIKTEQAKVPEQIATSKRQQVEQLRETKARAADPFYDAKKAADASATGMSGMPKVNEQIRQEQQQFFAYKAEKAGKTVGGFRQDLTKQIGTQAYAIGQERQFAKTEAQTTFAGRARELQGVDVAKATAEGATGEEASKVQNIIEEFAASLRKVDPNLGLGEARKAATKLAEGLAKGDQSVKQIIEANSELQAVFNKTFTETQNLDEAFKRVAEAAGLSEQSLRAEISPQKIKEQQFISSKEGQRFGGLAEFAPGLTEKFSKTRIGKGLGAGADFISGKGGKLSRAFAGAGGFTGIGAGVATGAEALKQFLPKSVTSDPNTAGALGALGGAGSGAAIGAQLGSFAGPIGTLIGGVGGAIIGGIQGFFSGKNQAILTNALENIAKTTGDLDQAFKKLESEASAVNLENAQKAFGDVLAAGQPIEDLAFSKTGVESIGSTFTGGVDKVSTGFAEGDISKIVLGGLQTAFGATGGGLLVDYFSAPSEAQRTEAIGSMVGGAGQRNESAARLAESGLKFKSTEEVGKIFDNIKTGTGELNPITEQYIQGALKAAEAANGTKQLTAEQTKSITVQAKERAALDAYMKKRKESGATDEQIAKEISSNRGAAQKEGEEALKTQGELAAKQDLLAKATKQVAIATESLLDVYRRIGAEAQRYSDELDQFSSDVNALVSGLGGDTSTREVNRTNEQVLGNVSAYSTEEVRAAANATAGFLGGTPEAQNLANQAVGQKLVQDQIPALLRTAGKDTDAQDNALEAVKNLLSSQGLEGSAIDTILGDLKNELAKGQGLSEAELQDTVTKSFSTVGKGLEQLQNVTKKYNDTLQQARKFQADYNKAILESGSYLRKADQVRLNAELDLAKALGRSPSLEELNKPFDAEISSLTGGLVQSGDLAAGASSDPTAIAAAITSAEKRKQAIEKASPELTAAGANIPAGPAGDPLRQQLNQAQLENIQAVGELTVASAEGRQALEKLANDGTKAANALGKIQEQQQAIEGFADFAQKVFTAEPQELAKMELQAVALNAAQVSGPEFFESRQNRQNAFAGLEQERGFMTKDEYNQTRASLIRKSFESQINPATGQAFKGTDVVKNIAGKDITLDELTKRLEGGIDETDPNVIAYREATEIQAQANIELGKIYQTQSEILAAAMMDLGKKLTEDFPNIVANAAANAQTDAQTKPEVKPEKKPPEPSYAETRVSEGQAQIDQGQTLLNEAKKDRDKLGYFSSSEEVRAVNTKERKAKQMIAGGKETVSQFGPLAAKDKAVREMETSLEAQRAYWAKAEEKTKQTEANKVKAQDAIDRAVQTREGGRPVATDGSGRVAAGTVAKPSAQVVIPSQTKVEVAGVPKAPIQAPPAPGTEQPVKDKATRQKEEAKKAAAAEIKNLEPLIADRQKEIAKRENKLKAARIAAMGAGTLKDKSGQVVNPNVLGAQSSLDASKEALVVQQAELAKQKQILAEQSKTAEEKQGQVTSQPSPLDAAQVSGPVAEGKTDTEVKSATEGVQTSVAQLQSPLDLVAQMATAALQSGSIYTHDVGLQERLDVLLESMNTLGSLASGEPGLAVSDAKVLEALNNLQAPFAALEQMAIASLSEGINTKDATLAAIASVFTPAINQVSAGVSALLAPINAISPVIATALDVIATPIKAIAGAFGVEMSTGQALQTAMGPAGALGSYVAGNAVGAIQNMATPQPQVSDKPITPNRLELANANAANRVVSAPVPVTMPPQASFINQQTTTQQIPSTTPTEGQLLTIDPTSIEKLNTFNTNFASYVDKLVTFEFPTIPDVIEMRGNHVVDVRISGAAAFEGLKKDFETMMQSEIKKAMGKIWDKTGGAMGASPNS